MIRWHVRALICIALTTTVTTVQGQVLAAGIAFPEGAAADREKQSPSTPLESAVDEFRIQTRNLGMRPGAAAAAARNAGPKPQWHGRFFENLRNDVFDAVPHEITQRGGTKSLLRRNQFGFNVAGPVVIPRVYNGTRTTFFSFSYEGMREKISRSRLLSVATPLERNGDFSRTVDEISHGSPLGAVLRGDFHLLL